MGGAHHFIAPCERVQTCPTGFPRPCAAQQDEKKPAIKGRQSQGGVPATTRQGGPASGTISKQPSNAAALLAKGDGTPSTPTGGLGSPGAGGAGLEAEVDIVSLPEMRLALTHR